MSRPVVPVSCAASVCLASYNGDRFILQQVHSILAQMGDADELIISDNGSSDATLRLLAGVADERMRVVHGRKKGVVANFENALLEARRDLIVLSDQDDVWLPGRLAKARAALEQHDLSVVGLAFVDQALRPLARSSAVRRPARSLLATLLMNGYTGCAMAFRRELLHRALPFPVRVPMHDWWIAAIALATGARIDICAEEMILYRRHGDNVSATGKASRTGFGARLYMRLMLTTQLAGRCAARRIWPAARDPMGH